MYSKGNFSHFCYSSYNGKLRTFEINILCNSIFNIGIDQMRTAREAGVISVHAETFQWCFIRFGSRRCQKTQKRGNIKTFEKITRMTFNSQAQTLFSNCFSF